MRCGRGAGALGAATPVGCEGAPRDWGQPNGKRNSDVQAAVPGSWGRERSWVVRCEWPQYGVRDGNEGRGQPLGWEFEQGGTSFTVGGGGCGQGTA